MKYNNELELNLNPQFDYISDDYDADLDLDEEIEDDRRYDSEDEEQAFCRASRWRDRDLYNIRSISLEHHLPYIIQQMEGRSW